MLLAFVTIANFDVLPVDHIYDDMFNFPETDSYSSFVEDLTFENRLFIQNAGTLALMLMLFTILILISGVLYLFRRKQLPMAKL